MAAVGRPTWAGYGTVAGRLRPCLVGRQLSQVPSCGCLMQDNVVCHSPGQAARAQSRPAHGVEAWGGRSSAQDRAHCRQVHARSPAQCGAAFEGHSDTMQPADQESKPLLTRQSHNVRHPAGWMRSSSMSCLLRPSVRYACAQGRPCGASTPCWLPPTFRAPLQ